VNNIHSYVLLYDPKLNVDEVAPNGVKRVRKTEIAMERWR